MAFPVVVGEIWGEPHLKDLEVVPYGKRRYSACLYSSLRREG